MLFTDAIHLIPAKQVLSGVNRFLTEIQEVLRNNLLHRETNTNKMGTNQSESLIETVFEWVFTIIAVVLLARLALLLFNLIFNFSETPLGQRLAEGTPFEFLTSMSPEAILIQIAIFVVIATILVVSKRAKTE